VINFVENQAHGWTGLAKLVVAVGVIAAVPIIVLALYAVLLPVVLR